MTQIPEDYSEPNDFENETLSTSADPAMERKVYSQSTLRRGLESLQEDLLQDFRSRLQIAPYEEGVPLNAASQSHALSVLEECQARVFGSYQARVAAGGDMHVKAQTDLINSVNTDMTF